MNKFVLLMLKTAVSRLGPAITWLASVVVAWVTAQVAKYAGLELTPEQEAAGVLFISQLLWGIVISVANGLELKYKKELQAILGNVKIDGLIGAETLKRAKTVGRKKPTKKRPKRPAARASAKPRISPPSS